MEASSEGDALAAAQASAFDAIVAGGVHALEMLLAHRPGALRILVARGVSFELASDAINRARVDGLLREEEGADALVHHLARRLASA